MKKSELRSLIRECVNEVIAEASMRSLLQQFINSSVPPAHKDEFINLLYPLLSQSTEDPEKQKKLVKVVISAAIGQPISPSEKAVLKDFEIDIDDKRIIAQLSKFHSYLVKFLKVLGG